MFRWFCVQVCFEDSRGPNNASNYVLSYSSPKLKQVNLAEIKMHMDLEDIRPL